MLPLTLCGRKFEKPLVMGVLNVTPDSFSDGGEFLQSEKAVERALQMVEEGADIIDIGGESSGPESQDVALEDELARVMPVLEIMRPKISALISVDTYKAGTAQRALALGADMINDVTALRGDAGMAKLLANFDAPVVLMYSKDSSARTTRTETEYEDVIATVKSFFEQQIALAVTAGIARKRLILDPGMGGFVSMKPEYSLQILKRLHELEVAFGLPMLIGPSRKSFIGQVLHVPLQPVSERLEGTLAAVAVAVMNSAAIVRVHDVKAARRVVDMTWAIKNS